ncbi:uncharacterized protein LOC107813568 [Nicotiana tabacum]|uniref:Uncharacterized protein LOC107813568 n=1 Tax=Nicotiana tabacum TaxID=4097 RepID=A0AC58RWQ4_TOBAC
MAANDVNVAHNIEGHENLPQHEDSISDTRNDGDEATPIYSFIKSHAVVRKVQVRRRIYSESHKHSEVGIGDEEYQTRFQKPIRPYPSQRDPNLWCEYHGIHRHITRDYRHLREQVATSLKNGHLREFLRNRAKNNYGRTRDNAEPSKIFRGNEINGVTFSAAKKIKVSVIHSKRLREVTEDDFTFREEDTDGLLLPHNDALVISLNVLDFKIKRVLVDPRSSANIIQWRMLEQAKLTGSIILATKLLIGFNLASVTTQQETMLPTNAEEITNTTLFKEVDDGMGYNIIIGRP